MIGGCGNAGKWESDLEGEVRHVIPLGDLIEHTRSVWCVCAPAKKVEWFGLHVVHHAADGREHREPNMLPEYQQKGN